MSTKQVIILVVIIAALGGSMAYYMMQVPDKPIAAKGEANCTATAAALPLVNVTTGMGITAAIAECE